MVMAMAVQLRCCFLDDFFVETVNMYVYTYAHELGTELTIFESCLAKKTAQRSGYEGESLQKPCLT